MVRMHSRDMGKWKEQRQLLNNEDDLAWSTRRTEAVRHWSTEDAHLEHVFVMQCHQNDWNIASREGYVHTIGKWHCWHGGDTGYCNMNTVMKDLCVWHDSIIFSSWQCQMVEKNDLSFKWLAHDWWLVKWWQVCICCITDMTTRFAHYSMMGGWIDWFIGISHVMIDQYASLQLRLCDSIADSFSMHFFDCWHVSFLRIPWLLHKICVSLLWWWWRVRCLLCSWMLKWYIQRMQHVHTVTPPIESLSNTI